MKVIKENIGKDHKDFKPDCGPFTQVKISVILKDSDKVTLVCQFFGMQAKILAGKFLSAVNWNPE